MSTALIEEDLTFRSKIEQRAIRFGKDDLLRAIVSVKQWREHNDDIKARYAIIEVIEHIAPSKPETEPFSFND